MAMSVVYYNAFGRVLGETRNGVDRTYVRDTRGSTIAMMDDTGAVTDTFDYYAFGDLRSRTGTTPTPFTWLGMLGYYTDQIGKWVYVRARHYRADLSRWLTVDPLWPRELAYNYCQNAPSELVDSAGLQQRGPGKGWPNTDRGLIGLPNYGNYCGQNTDCGPGGPPGIDCIDKACQRHDRCLDDAWVYSAADCNCALAASAMFCNTIGCLGNPECELTSALIVWAFGVICPISIVLFPPWGGHSNWPPPPPIQPGQPIPDPIPIGQPVRGAPWQPPRWN